MLGRRFDNQKRPFVFLGPNTCNNSFKRRAKPAKKEDEYPGPWSYHSKPHCSTAPTVNRSKSFHAWEIRLTFLRNRKYEEVKFFFRNSKPAHCHKVPLPRQHTPPPKPRSHVQSPSRSLLKYYLSTPLNGVPSPIYVDLFANCRAGRLQYRS